MRVRYYGYAGPTGYGVAARGIVAAMRAVGLEVDFVDVDPQPHPGPFQIFSRLDLGAPDLVVVHAQPLAVATILELARFHDPRVHAVPAAAYTTWEGARWPVGEGLLAGLAKFQHRWFPKLPPLANAFGRFNAKTPATEIIPHAFGPAAPVARVPSGPYSFYYRGVWSARKNVDGLIRAYVASFRPEHEVELVLYIRGLPADRLALTLAATGLGPGDVPRVRVVADELTDAQVHASHGAHDCYVTASRGEAWDLPAFEALRAGRPAIVTRGAAGPYIHRTDAMIVEGAVAPAMLDLDLRPRADGQIDIFTAGPQGMTSRDPWIDPDLSELGFHMREAYERRVSQAAFDPINLAYSYVTVGTQIRKALSV